MHQPRFYNPKLPTPFFTVPNRTPFKDTGHHLKKVVPYFADKLLYLHKRLLAVQEEMRRRGFKPTVDIDLSIYDESRVNDWVPDRTQIQDLKDRIKQRILEKPEFYRYFGEHQAPEFFLELLEMS